MSPSNRAWKLTGVAAVIGVVATGVLVTRNERERRSYTPDEVRDRLHQRLRETERPIERRESSGRSDPA